MLSFNAETGFSVQSAAEIRQAIVDDWTAVFDDETATLNTGSESPAGQIIDSLTVLNVAKDSEIMFVANQFNPRVASGSFQDALAQIYFLTRKTEQPTVVTCTCTGLYGTVIPAGSIVQSEDGLKFTSDGDATIPYEGHIDVEFSCTEPGAISVGANAVTKIVSVIPGWDTVNNSIAGTPGSLVESRSAMERRRALSVAANAHGSRLALQGSLMTIDGVVDCLVLENKTDYVVVKKNVVLPGHSVGICIYGGQDDDIAEMIYNKLDAGCGTAGNTEVNYTDDTVNNYWIYRPTTKNVYITVEINRTETMVSTVVDDIKNAVYADFYGNDTNSDNPRVGLGQKIFASRFSVAIIKTAGVTDLVSIKLGWNTTSIGQSLTINADTEPVLDIDNITVIINE